MWTRRQREERSEEGHQQLGPSNVQGKNLKGEGEDERMRRRGRLSLVGVSVFAKIGTTINKLSFRTMAEAKLAS